MQVKLLTQLTMERRLPEMMPPPPPSPTREEVKHKNPQLQLLVFNGTGSIDLFLERYEGYAVVQ